MAALERVLEENPTPLQEFSALSDFSGENIAFLTRLAEWKAKYDVEDTRRSFNEALVIYANFVSPRDAPFPLNLPSHDLKDLESMFEVPTRQINGEARVDAATPFTMEQDHTLREALDSEYLGDIPPEFSANTFDNAQSHVKYLVLTNTWPKFVANKNRRGSTDTGRTQTTVASETTLVSQISTKLSSIIKVGSWS